MKCYRCNGFMVLERFSRGIVYFDGWRCITCGEIIDETIVENRRKPKRLSKALMREREREQVEEWAGR